MTEDATDSSVVTDRQGLLDCGGKPRDQKVRVELTGGQTEAAHVG